MIIKLSALSFLLLISVTPAQFDTTGFQSNQWVNVWPGANPLPINGSNWAYENDFESHPFYPFFVMGPGHVVHPQDCYWYPYDPLAKKWSKIHSPNRHPRSCLGSFCIGSQDTSIFFLGGGEAGHQLSQGSWNAAYNGIDIPDVAYQGTRGISMWVYEFNRNRWHTMKGLSTLPPTSYSRYPRYDEVHDVVISGQGSQTWVYNYHDNQSWAYNNPVTFRGGMYSNAVDEKRGLYYMLCGGTQAMYSFDPENTTWTQVTGTTIPGCVPEPSAGGNEPSINSLAYDPLHDIMLYVIGFSSPQTWKFDCATRQWQQLTPTASPAIMGRLAFNRQLNLFMQLGGEGASITRGGGTTGIWYYRYAAGAPAEAGMLPRPDAHISSASGSVRLSWKNMGATGYNIYRGAVNPYPKGFTKLNPSPVTDTFYTDNSLTLTSTSFYSYRVCAVQEGIEGKRSRHLYTRPSRPLGAVASVESANLANVTWYANPEPDIAGYNLYRGRGVNLYTSLGSYTKINTALITTTSFDDNVDLSDKVARGYAVTAVNAAGLESAPSPVAPTFADSPEWAWGFPSGANFTLRWQPPTRTKIKGINLYRTAYPKVLINTAGLITDTVSTWPLPPQTGTDATALQGKCYLLRAVNMLDQEGFGTDQISPTNSDFGFGVPTPADRFSYAKYAAVALEAPVPATGPDAPFLDVWPNPFNPGIRYSFRTPKAGNATVEIFEMNGRRVLFQSSSLAAGLHNRQLTLTGHASGVYTMVIKQNGKSWSRRISLVK